MIVCFAVQLSMYSISLFSLFQVFLLLEPALLYYHVSFDLSTPFFIFFDVVFVCNTICGDSVSRIPHRKTLSGITHCLPIMFSERRRRDLNPRAAVNDLLPFQGSPFGQLGYFSKRRGWDSNPRVLADKRFSRPPRYDHFDTSPHILLLSFLTTLIS